MRGHIALVRVLLSLIGGGCKKTLNQVIDKERVCDLGPGEPTLDKASAVRREI